MKQKIAQATCNAAMAVTSATIVAMSLALVFYTAAGGPHLTAARAGTILWSLALLGALLARRHNPTTRLGVSAFLLNQLGVVPILWLATEWFASSGEPWMPFLGHKTMALVIAAVAPPQLWVGLASVGLIVGAALIQFASLSQAAKDLAIRGEPWAVLVWSVLAVAVIVYRVRSFGIGLRLSQERAERELAERIGTMAIAVRDLANTPIQTLQLTAAALRAHCPDEEALVDRIDRSVERLKELNHVLGDADCARGTEPSLSFDAATRLDDALRSTGPRQEGELAKYGATPRRPVQS